MTDADKWWDSFCIFWRDFGWSIFADARSNLEKTETGIDVPHGVIENAERLMGDGRRFISYTEKIGEIDASPEFVEKMKKVFQQMMGNFSK